MNEKMEYCLTDIEFNTIAIALKERTDRIIKQRTKSSKEAVDRILEVKWKLYQLKCDK